MLYCHASPRNDLDIFTERTPEERIVVLFAGVDADVVVCGHTHTQFERDDRAACGSSTPAASASPYEDEPGAYWLLDLEHRRTPYDGADARRRRATRRSREFTERGL